MKMVRQAIISSILLTLILIAAGKYFPSM